MVQKTRTQLDQRAAVEIDRKFSASALPRTMELATVLKAILLPQLTSTPAPWPYHDRVLHWLLPSLGEDIQNFHGRNGPPICEMFGANAVEHLDEDLLARLVLIVDRLRPGLISQLHELSSGHNDEEAS